MELIMNPSSFTHEYLSGLKFKELQKLSVQFHVNKRWAKKQELIQNLLSLRENNFKEDDEKQNEKEWRDGSLVFNDLNQNSNENEVNRRFTFNVTTKTSTGSIDPRSTFEIPQNGKNLLDSNEAQNSRETYDIAPTKTDFGVDPRATFEIPQKGKLIMEEIDPRATFLVSQNGKELFESETNKNSVKAGKKKTPENTKDKRKKSDEKPKSEIKMLTIPYARVTRRNKKDGDAFKNDNSPIKLSKKSINIKKSVRLPTNKVDLIKSPMLSSMKKTVNKQTIVQSLKSTQSGKVVQSKIPTRLQFNEEKLKPINKTTKVDEENKENMKKTLPREKSKTADEVLVKKSNLLKVSFMSPPVSLRKTKRVCLPIKKTPLKRETDNKLTSRMINSSNSQTPGGKPPVATKPITVTKMPDFSKIHKKQFEQMDSLHDYLKKKEERSRKLFGTPQPGPQFKPVNKSASVFQFQSFIPEKGNENSNKLTTPFKKKDDDAKAAQKEAFKNKLPPSKLQTDIKDKKRSHIHGVRTNKRFELQMKFRNM